MSTTAAVYSVSTEKTAEDGGLPWIVAAPAGLEGVRFLQRILKEGFHRSRPSPLLTDFSYPSAHTARFAFCVALMFCTLLPRLSKGSPTPPQPTSDWLAAAALSCALMGSSRVLADAHWPSDTVGGACLGVSVAAAVDVLWGAAALLVAEKRDAAGRGQGSFASS